MSRKKSEETSVKSLTKMCLFLVKKNGRKASAYWSEEKKSYVFFEKEPALGFEKGDKVPEGWEIE